MINFKKILRREISLKKILMVYNPVSGSAIFKKALKLCTDDDLLYRIAFYLEVLRNTGSDAVRTYLAERMEKAGMEIPDGFIYQDMYEE